MSYDLNRTNRRAPQEYRKRISFPLTGDSGSPWFRKGMSLDTEVLYLPPGGTSWPHRFQTSRWGLYSIEQGVGRVRTSMGLIEVRAGDCILQPPGRACQIINSGEGDLWVMIVMRQMDLDRQTLAAPEAG